MLSKVLGKVNGFLKIANACSIVKSFVVSKGVTTTTTSLIVIISKVNFFWFHLDSKLIRLIRENDRIRSLVYVSCQPDGPAMKNFVDLVKKEAKGEPFQLKKAIPVDMFPHTDHCEMVLLFQRWQRPDFS